MYKYTTKKWNTETDGNCFDLQRPQISRSKYHHKPCHHLCLSAITYRLSLFQTIDKQQKAIGYIYLAYPAIEIER